MATTAGESSATGTRLTCVFWNVNRQDRAGLVAGLAAQVRADIVVLAESGSKQETMLDTLRRDVQESFVEPNCVEPRIQLFARRADLDLHEVYGDTVNRLTIRLLCFERTKFLFAAIHFPSKLQMKDEEQSLCAPTVADLIRKEEQRQNHCRTVLCGDFNMNPFDVGMVSATGFHAMMAKSTVEAHTREVKKQKYPFFYNPMWGCFGDRTDGPPATYYYTGGRFIKHYWHMYDQVLLRRDVLPWFGNDLEIVTKIGDTELADTTGRPNPEVASDHFPIVFRLVAPR